MPKIQTPTFTTAAVSFLRIIQYALVALAALTSMGALASQSMNAIAGAVLGVYVLVMLGFVWAIETLGVAVLRRRYADD